MGPPSAVDGGPESIISVVDRLSFRLVALRASQKAGQKVGAIPQMRTQRHVRGSLPRGERERRRTADSEYDKIGHGGQHDRHVWPRLRITRV